MVSRYFFSLCCLLTVCFTHPHESCLYTFNDTVNAAYSEFEQNLIMCEEASFATHCRREAHSIFNYRIGIALDQYDQCQWG